ncbi:hypothetical protein BASA81_000519 [Batrachochytrium salamandrivorans]|nr:hypothetical protein BASA81_000519 [Batrachochytrium salamandrivorans]
MVRLSLGGERKPKPQPVAPRMEVEGEVPTTTIGAPFDFSKLDAKTTFMANLPSKRTHQTPMAQFRATLHGNLLIVPSGKNIALVRASSSSSSSQARQCLECFAQTKLDSSLTVEDRIRAYQRIFPVNTTEYKLWTLVDALYGNTHRKPSKRLSGFSARMHHRQQTEINLFRVEGLDVWLRANCAQAPPPSKKKRPTLQDLRKATLRSQEVAVPAQFETWLDDFAGEFWKSLEPLKNTLPVGDDTDVCFLLLVFAAKPTKESLERLLLGMNNTSLAWHMAQVLFELLPLSERSQLLLTLTLCRELEFIGEVRWAAYLLDNYVPDDSVREKLLLDLIGRNLARSSSGSVASPEYTNWAKACQTRHLDHVILSADQDFFCTEFGSKLGPKLCLQGKYSELAKFERYLVTGEVKPWERNSLLWCCLLIRFARLSAATTTTTAKRRDSVGAFQLELEMFCTKVQFRKHALCLAAVQKMAEFVAVKQQSRPLELVRALQLLPVPTDLKKKMIALHCSEILQLE